MCDSSIIKNSINLGHVVVLNYLISILGCGVSDATNLSSHFVLNIYNTAKILGLTSSLCDRGFHYSKAQTVGLCTYLDTVALLMVHAQDRRRDQYAQADGIDAPAAVDSLLNAT